MKKVPPWEKMMADWRALKMVDLKDFGLVEMKVVRMAHNSVVG